MNNNASNIPLLPPSPPTQPTQSKNRKILLAAIIIAIIAVAGIAGAIAVMNNNPAQIDNTNPTPSPATITTPTPTTPNQPQTNLAEAKSIQFDMSYTSEDSTTQFAYKFSAKNIGSANMMVKVEGTFSEDNENVIYIVNGAQQKAWMYSDNQWTDLTDDFQSQWNTWSSTWQSYMQEFNTWSGVGDFTYTVPFSGDTLKISNVQINPQLPDSLFAP